MFNNYNPYYQPQYQPQRFQPQLENQYNQYSAQTQQPQQPQFRQQVGLQGKSVDSLEVVKAMDIPLDGSVSYFPLTDGTAIITKQLQQDGTSKTIVYKPVDTEEINKIPKYVTVDELNEAIKKTDNNGIKDLKEEIKNIKRQIKDINDDIKDISDDIKERKD